MAWWTIFGLLYENHLYVLVMNPFFGPKITLKSVSSNYKYLKMDQFISNLSAWALKNVWRQHKETKHMSWLFIYKTKYSRQVNE
jgi:hypothetical protein